MSACHMHFVYNDGVFSVGFCVGVLVLFCCFVLCSRVVAIAHGQLGTALVHALR